MNERMTWMIAALSRVAWADGRLLPAEARFFADVLGALELAPDEAARMWRAVVMPPADYVGLESAGLDEADRRHLLAVSYAMAGADGGVCEAELAELRALAHGLGISWADALAIVGHPLPW